MLLLSNKSILDTAQWSHNAQSFSSYIRFVGSGYSCLFLPPEGNNFKFLSLQYRTSYQPESNHFAFDSTVNEF